MGDGHALMSLGMTDAVFQESTLRGMEKGRSTYLEALLALCVAFSSHPICCPSAKNMRNMLLPVTTRDLKRSEIPLT